MFKVFLFCLLVIFSQEGYVSGSATGGVGTTWYSLQVINSLRISPAGGDYSSIHEEGKEYDKKLAPLKQKLENIILEAKEKFSAPIEQNNSMKLGDSIFGVIIENEMEFDSNLNLHYLKMDKDEQKETLDYEKKQFDRLKLEENENSKNCKKYFKSGTLQSISIRGEQYSDLFEYHIVLWVSSRIKRSTLNWIKREFYTVMKKDFNL